ncbi:hypothetical protein R6Q59_013262 [Mikania micrantha]
MTLNIKFNGTIKIPSGVIIPSHSKKLYLFLYTSSIYCRDLCELLINSIVLVPFCHLYVVERSKNVNVGFINLGSRASKSTRTLIAKSSPFTYEWVNLVIMSLTD